MPVHLHKFIEALFNTESITLILGTFGDFAILLFGAKVRTSVFDSILETLLGILSLSEWSHELALTSFWHPHVQKSFHMTFI